MSDAINLYTQVVAIAVPFATAFAICDWIVMTFLGMAFGGKLVIK